MVQNCSAHLETLQAGPQRHAGGCTAGGILKSAAQEAFCHRPPLLGLLSHMLHSCMVVMNGHRFWTVAMSHSYALALPCMEP